MRQQAELLSTQQRESLERDGYLLVPSLLDETVLGPIVKDWHHNPMSDSD